MSKIILAVSQDMRGKSLGFVADDVVPICGLEGLLYNNTGDRFPMEEARVKITRVARNYGSSVVLLGIHLGPTSGAKNTAEFLFEHSEVKTVLVICTKEVPEKPNMIALTFHKMVSRQFTEILDTKIVPRPHVWFHSAKAARELNRELSEAA